MGSSIDGGGEEAGTGGGGDWGFSGVVGRAGEEGSEPKETGRDSGREARNLAMGL